MIIMRTFKQDMRAFSASLQTDEWFSLFHLCCFTCKSQQAVHICSRNLPVFPECTIVKFLLGGLQILFLLLLVCSFIGYPTVLSNIAISNSMMVPLLLASWSLKTQYPFRSSNHALQPEQSILIYFSTFAQIGLPFLLLFSYSSHLSLI